LGAKQQILQGDCAVTLPIMLKRPSAFIPVAMSIMALVLVLVSVGFSGVAREADEGATAHLWQLLIVGQLPVVAFFAFKWLPRAPRFAFPVLALQALALVAALSPVYFLHL
jgi:hypothetical protein